MSGELERKRNIGQGSSNSKIGIYIGIVILVALVAAIAIMVMPAKTVTDASLLQPIPGGDGKLPPAVPGTPTPSPTGQEKITSWYALTDGPKDIKLEKYNTTIRIRIGELGTSTVEPLDQNLYKASKSLIVNMRFRIKGETKFVETGPQKVGLTTGELAPNIDWRFLMDDKQQKINPETIEWQAGFIVENRDIKQPQKVSI